MKFENYFFFFNEVFNNNKLIFYLIKKLYIQKNIVLF